MADDLDRLIDVLLCEELGGEGPPNLEERVLARAGRRRGIRLWHVAAAAAVLLVGLGTWQFLTGGYPRPHASGSYTVADGGAVRRGTTLRTEDQPAALTLGGYAHVEVEPQSVVRLEGARRAEQVFLGRGGVACDVDPKVGAFAVRTDLGSVQSVGTRFSVRILEEKGETEMVEKRLWVSVLAGVVLASGAWGRQALAAGQEKALPEKAPAKGEKAPAPKMTTLSHVDDSAEGKRSLAGSGHAVEFECPAGARWVEAVQIFGARYGSPQPPKEDFHVTVLDANRKVLADVPFPYAKVERGTMKWHALETPSVEVTPRFIIAVAFNPEQTKGVYLGYDEKVKESHSLVGLPDQGFQEVAEKQDWMIRVVVSNVPSGKRGIIRLPDRAAAKGPNLDLPPCVVETSPADRATDVDYGLREIKVTFDRPMMGGQQWSWIIHTDLGVYPGYKGSPDPRWEDGGKTCVLPVRLSPDTLYAVGVNSFRHTGFRDPAGKIAVPHVWVFKTRKKAEGGEF